MNFKVIFEKEIIIMGARELKEKIQEHLSNADETVLSIVNSVFESYYKEKPVAFYPDGSPMSLSQYNEALAAAEDDIINGDYISIEDFEKEDY